MTRYLFARRKFIHLAIPRAIDSGRSKLCPAASEELTPKGAKCGYLLITEPSAVAWPLRRPPMAFLSSVDQKPQLSVHQGRPETGYCWGLAG
jgi:hypothetical protein